MMDEQVKKSLQPVRVIVIAMSLGLVVFSVVTVVMVTGKMMEPSKDIEGLQNILVALLVVLSMGESVAYFVMRGAKPRRARKEADNHSVRVLYQSSDREGADDVALSFMGGVSIVHHHVVC